MFVAKTLGERASNFIEYYREPLAIACRSLPALKIFHPTFEVYVARLLKGIDSMPLEIFSRNPNAGLRVAKKGKNKSG
jgi:hypothetical protein